jgi:hypothetical protein
MSTFSTYIELFDMRQLHVQYSQLWHSFEGAQHCSEPFYSESVAIAISLLSRAAET